MPRQVAGPVGAGYRRVRRQYRPPVGALVVAGVVAALHMLFLVSMTVGGFLELYRLAWIWPSVGVTVYSVFVTLTSSR